MCDRCDLVEILDTPDDEVCAVCPWCGGDPDYEEWLAYEPYEGQPDTKVPCPLCGGGKHEPIIERAGMVDMPAPF